MLNFISKLQRKPEHVRKQIAFLFSAAVTGVIVIFWLVSISFSEPVTVVSDTKEVGPFKAFTEGVSAFFRDTTETFTGMMRAFSELPKQTPAETEETTSESVSE